MAETQAAMMETVEDLKRLRARMKTESLEGGGDRDLGPADADSVTVHQRYFVKGAMIGAIKG